MFLNTGSRNIKSTCSIHYGACQREFSQDAQGFSTTEFSDQVVIHNIKPSGSDCYTVRASNNTYTVIVEGSFNTGSGREFFKCSYDCCRFTIHLHVGRSNTAAVAAGVIVALFLLILFSVILIVAIYMIVRRLKGSAPPGRREIESVNKTFSIKESIDSPNHHYEEPTVATASEDEDKLGDPPDKHASVPEPAKKTVLQKGLHEELAAMV